MNPNTLIQVCWLRESGPAHLDADFGTPVPADRLELALMGLASRSPRDGGPYDGPDPESHGLEVSHILGALQSLDRVQSLPKWMAWRFSAFFGPLKTPAAVSAARENFASLSRACDSVRRTAGNRPWTELYLPYFTRSMWTNRFALLDRMKFVQKHGWVQAAEGVDPLSLGDIVTRVSAGVFQPGPDRDLPFRFFLGCRNGLFRHPWIDGLAARWGIRGLPQDIPVSAIDMRVSSRAVEAWRKSPRSHHGRYHLVWARTALAVQWILRRWNLALQTSSPEGFEDVEGCRQALLFNCLRPWAENGRTDLCYDVLDDGMMSDQFQRAVPRLENALEQMAAYLDATGKPNLAARYRSEEPQFLAARIADRGMRNKAIRGMLHSEELLINALMRYANEVKSAESPRLVRKCSDALAVDFRALLPRIFRHNMIKELESAVFLEAMSAMHCAISGEPPMDVRIETVDGYWHINNRMPTEDAA